MHQRGVYYLMPSFRGEDTDQLHLAQFYHAEAEIPGTLDDIMELASRMLQFITDWLLTKCRDSIMAIAGDVAHIEQLLSLEAVYPKIRMGDALDSLRDGDGSWIRQHQAGFEMLSKDGEKELYRRLGPCWITHFDHMSVPFYQAFEPGTNQAQNADLILGGCETIGSGHRHATSDEVAKALQQHEVSPVPYEWYMAMRDEIMMHTSGFGMGIERYLLWLLKHDDIRDMMILYRENRKLVIP